MCRHQRNFKSIEDAHCSFLPSDLSTVSEGMNMINVNKMNGWDVEFTASMSPALIDDKTLTGPLRGDYFHALLD